MNTYEAYVKVEHNNMVIKTLIRAENSQQAYFLLQGQYGQSNVVHLPQEVHKAS